MRTPTTLEFIVLGIGVLLYCIGIIATWIVLKRSGNKGSLYDFIGLSLFWPMTYARVIGNIMRRIKP